MLQYVPIAINFIALHLCSKYNQFDLGTATRLCDISGNWETPVLANCSSYEYRFLMELVEQVLHMYIAVLLIFKVVV